MFFNLKKKTSSAILLLLIIVYPWAFHVFQGIYIAELGYWLISYEHFFSTPEIAQTTFYSWFTTFIGAIVNLGIGKFGVIGFKIANVFIIYSILFIVYQLLHPFTKSSYVLFFILISEVLIHSYYFINYYSLTTLFFAISTLFLVRGLIHNRSMYIFLAGVFLSLNIFIRFPNILGLMFLLGIVYYQISKDPLLYKLVVKQVAILLFGYMISIALILLIMKSFGHLDYYLENIKNLFDLARSHSSHGTSTIVIAYFKAQFFAAIESFKLWFILSIVLILLELCNKYPQRKYAFTFLLIMIGTYSLLLATDAGLTNYMLFYNGIIGFVYISLVWIIVSEFKDNINFGLIALLSMLSIQIIPFGSATVLHQAKFGLYLALPIIFIYFINKRDFFIYKIFLIHSSSLKQVSFIVGFILIIYSIVTVSVYHPPGLEKERWNMRYSVDNPHLKFNYMSKEKAQTLDELIENMHQYSNEITYILTYEGISTVSYLSDLEPYLNNTYPFFMTIDNFKKELAYQQLHKS